MSRCARCDARCIATHEFCRACEKKMPGKADRRRRVIRERLAALLLDPAEDFTKSADSARAALPYGTATARMKRVRPGPAGALRGATRIGRQK